MAVAPPVERRPPVVDAPPVVRVPPVAVGLLPPIPAEPPEASAPPDANAPPIGVLCGVLVVPPALVRFPPVEPVPRVVIDELPPTSPLSSKGGTASSVALHADNNSHAKLPGNSHLVLGIVRQFPT